MKKKEHKLLVKNFIHDPAIVVQANHTIEEALSSLRTQKRGGKILYFYVVDEENRLQGTVSARSLLLADPNTKIHEIMERMIHCLREDESFEEAVEALSHHRLLALPVVDKAHKLKGIVDVQMCLEENIDLLKEQRNQDIFQLVGMTLEECAIKSPLKAYAKRMPWILCNMFGGIACAIVSYFFKLVLGKVIILAMFIPLVLSLSESISMQSMTQSFQILRRQHISLKKIAFLMLSEMKVAILMAFTSGLLVAVISLFWHTDPKVSGTIGFGIALSVSLSAVIGAGVPFLLFLRKLDPKVASGPVVLTIADVITTAIYLSLATFWLL